MKATAQLITVATLFAIAAVPPATARAPLSVSGYRSHANAICAQEQQKTMSRLMGSKNLAQYLAQEVPVLRSALQSFQRLDPPTTLSSLHAQVIAIVKGDITLFSTLAKQARAGRSTPPPGRTIRNYSISTCESLRSGNRLAQRVARVRNPRFHIARPGLTWPKPRRRGEDRAGGASGPGSGAV